MKQYDRSILRLVDANLNRAIEGIRVLEESARMIFDDAVLTHELKSLRHSLLEIFSKNDVFRTSLIMARGSDRDVLRHGETVSEGSRAGFPDIVRANASRAREAIRNLEEYGKLIDNGISEKCKGIRFRLYDAEQLLIGRFIRNEKASLERLRLIVLIDPPEHLDAGSLALSAANAGAGIIVCLDSSFSGSKRLPHLEAMLDSVRGHDVTVLGWDRTDIALASGADGVLLDYEGIAAEAVRAISPRSWVVGKTVPDIGEFDIRAAADDDSDFVFIDTDTNVRGDFVEPEDFKECIDAMPVPVVILSPSDKAYISDLFDLGVAGIALRYTPETPGTVEKMRKLADTSSKRAE